MTWWLETQEEFEMAQAKMAYPGVELTDKTNMDAIEGWNYWDREVLGLMSKGISELLSQN
ncbi:hypothetical protein M408DRAFT_23136 [Serendipita vermifera MAFF 305830]|uniref:Uncharacterized protein n=1 Tax=Serendipita vermifera MAFF 305830 TaxID=933852 RepID=A0A0C2WTA1_SERVB|nr:hypothetical protein M408DRAFT_23136 [Serendipita vermifera MAFF 305830]